MESDARPSSVQFKNINKFFIAAYTFFKDQFGTDCFVMRVNRTKIQNNQNSDIFIGSFDKISMHEIITKTQ